MKFYTSMSGSTSMWIVALLIVAHLSGCRVPRTTSLLSGNPDMEDTEHVVVGFAFTTEWGATIQRGENLAVCDALPSWPPEVERFWVRASGRFRENPACAGPGITLFCPPLLQGCSVEAGGRLDDVLPSDWEALRASRLAGDTPELGQTVQVTGPLSLIVGFTFVETPTLRLIVHCEVPYQPGTVVLASGSLGYRPPKLPISVDPAVAKADPMPRSGWFTIERCTAVRALP